MSVLTKNHRNARTNRVAVAILAYLSDHPSAMDTAEGIAKWWVKEDVADVEKALQMLMAQGTIKRRAKVYSLATKSRKGG